MPLEELPWTMGFRVWPQEAGRLYILGIGDDYGG